MSRHDESIGRMPNPSQYYLEWNSELKSFCYYSSETEERVPFPLPFRFVALKFVNTITGYDESRSMGIYANEVSDTRYEHFRVSYRDGSFLASGLYSDIKEQVQKVGGRFTRSIYAITAKGIVVNIKLKGGQMINFGAIEKFGNRWQDEFIQVASYETKLHGDKEYTVPVFTFGGTLSDTDSKKAEESYSLIKSYFGSKPATTGSSAARPVATTSAPATAQVSTLTADDDDLPF